MMTVQLGRLNWWQECFPVGCVPPPLYFTEILPRQKPPWTRPLLDRDPSWTETPPGQRPLLDRDLLRAETPLPVNRITHRCTGVKTLPFRTGMLFLNGTFSFSSLWHRTEYLIQTWSLSLESVAVKMSKWSIKKVLHKQQTIKRP